MGTPIYQTIHRLHRLIYKEGRLKDWVRISLTARYFGPSRAHDALFDVSLPSFVISNAALGLFASQLHFLGYVIDSLGPILFLIKAVTRRSEVILVRRGPLCFYFFGGLNAPCLWHACGLPSGGFFRLGILHAGPENLKNFGPTVFLSFVLFMANFA